MVYEYRRQGSAVGVGDRECFALPPAFGSAGMAVYYFDFREGDELVVDEEGMELIGIGAAQNEAARSLAGIAWGAMRSDGAQAQEMAVEVRDVHGPVMEVKFEFVIKRTQ